MHWDQLVERFKQKIDDITDIRAESQWLYYQERLLDGSIIGMWGIRPSSTINLVVRENLGLDFYRDIYNKILAQSIFSFWAGRRLFAVDLTFTIGGRNVIVHDDYICYLGVKVKNLICQLDVLLSDSIVKLPRGWRDREAIVRRDSTVMWQTDGGQKCELDLFAVAADQALFIEYGGDWETADEQENDDPEIPVNVRKLGKAQDFYLRR